VSRDDGYIVALLCFAVSLLCFGLVLSHNSDDLGSVSLAGVVQTADAAVRFFASARGFLLLAGIVGIPVLLWVAGRLARVFVARLDLDRKD
jgi:hypothetical protein